MSSGRSNDHRLRTGQSHPLNSGKDRATGAALSQNLSHHSNSSVTDIRVELQQKDELIAALIAELEKAADQLDRVQRTGGDRGQIAQPHSPGELARELFDKPAQASDELRQMAEDWQQSQPTATLERIESQLAAMHDLLLNAQFSNQSNYGSSQRYQSSDDANKTIDESSLSWDKIKEQMLGLDPGTSASISPKSAQATETTPASQSQNIAEPSYAQRPPQATDPREAEFLKMICETPAPRAVDFVHADIEAMKKAIIERDDYIIQINRLFRTHHSISLPQDWAALANVPGEMQIRVETLLQHLDVQVRLGEVEMSLDRARLARERSQVENDRETIDKHMKRLGLSSLAELENIGTATGSASDRRWMRFLGPNSKSQ